MMKINTSQDIELTTQRLIIKTVDATFADRTLEYYSNNKQAFSDSMAQKPHGFYTLIYQKEKIWNEFEAMVSQKAIRLYLFGINDLKYEKIIGDIVINNINLKITKSCDIGYKLDSKSWGNGLMQEALKHVIYNFLYSTLNLHRVVAYILESNIASIKLIEKLGFNKEGVARDLVKINGQWQDHLQYSLINNG